MMVHTISLTHVLQGKDTICIIQIPAPSKGTNGTSGVLNGRLRFGSVFLRMSIDIHTMVNAINVPIDTNSLSTCSGNNPANIPVIMQAKTVELCGTRCLLCIFEKNLGKRPSLDIA